MYLPCFTDKETGTHEDEVAYPMSHNLWDEACDSHAGLPDYKASQDTASFLQRPNQSPPPPGGLPSNSNLLSHFPKLNCTENMNLVTVTVVVILMWIIF